MLRPIKLLTLISDMSYGHNRDRIELTIDNGSTTTTQTLKVVSWNIRLHSYYRK